ncbi:MAG: 4Fe-4S binding protein [Candidatus Diapherotrites archaeon]|nr:4Fe-4S binding protein [Candidatus Diapherotrites archaeon]
MITPKAKAGSSIKTKTGDWKNQFPEINSEKCIKCGICQSICPEGILGKKGEVPKPDLNYCKGCGLCASICPVKAIEMKRVDSDE